MMRGCFLCVGAHNFVSEEAGEVEEEGEGAR